MWYNVVGDNMVYLDYSATTKTNDEVLDTSLSLKLCKEADIVTISGGHKLRGPEFEFEFKELVDKLR